ncbi:redoxin domain-containing protein [Flavihumibacter rivuli]|uniref:TlpA family protein disulfide reductase n=1 Tax=Flavihumibacter rivuli TaxID=2838156 RepID=UPI001BDF5651|nr:redoxin domain-containing protein [Flavihumibacter rivuli]ULQ55446.1 redoxin domain-containing protein [Flavihumibacter rivuli]
MWKLFISGILLMPVTLFCQSKQLGIGDKLPPINVKVLKNGKLEVKPISVYYEKGGMILSFWATWCSSCIHSIKKINGQIKSSSSTVNILPITYEDASTVDRFVKVNPILKTLDLEYSVEDNALMGKLIEFKKLPHEVWVDRNGIIKAITGTEAVSSQSLALLSKGEDINVVMKTDNLKYRFGDTLPSTNGFLARSILTGYQGSLPNWIGSSMPLLYKGAKASFFCGNNQPVLSLYYAGFNDGSGVPVDTSRIILEVKDKYKLFPQLFSDDQDMDLLKDYMYCYELRSPFPMEAKELGKMIIDDLNRFFPYKGEVRKAYSKCLVLKLIDSKRLKAVAPSDAPLQAKFKKGQLIVAKNITADLLVKYLDDMLYPLRVVNGVDCLNSFDIEFGEVVPTERSLWVANINKSLEKNGLLLIEEDVLVDKLYITDK